MLGQTRKVDSLISQLNNNDPSIRNNAALQLADLGANQVVNALLDAILKVDNFGNNGTLVYALQKLDCSQKLVEVFAILFYQDYEAKLMAHQLLDQQVFEFSKEDLLTIQAMWHDCIKHPEKCPDFGTVAVRDMIEHDVAGYLSYLN